VLTCEAFFIQHSDCAYLKKLLFEEGLDELRCEDDLAYD
jgi:hypothetical protein